MSVKYVGSWLSTVSTVTYVRNKIFLEFFTILKSLLASPPTTYGCLAPTEFWKDMYRLAQMDFGVLETYSLSTEQFTQK